MEEIDSLNDMGHHHYCIKQIMSCDGHRTPNDNNDEKVEVVYKMITFYTEGVFYTSKYHSIMTLPVLERGSDV